MLLKLQKSDIKSEFGRCENRFVHQPQKLSFDSTRLCSQSPSSGIVLSSFRTQIVLYGMNALNICADQPPVTTLAARKWLMGEAMPTQDRIQLLAEWLNVSASWLRFGVKAMRSTEFGSERVLSRGKDFRERDLACHARQRISESSL